MGVRMIPRPWPPDSWPTAEEWTGWFRRLPEGEQLAEAARMLKRWQHAASDAERCFVMNHARLEAEVARLRGQVYAPPMSEPNQPGSSADADAEATSTEVPVEQPAKITTTTEVDPSPETAAADPAADAGAAEAQPRNEETVVGDNGDDGPTDADGVPSS